MTPEEEKVVLNGLIQERLNDPSESAKAEVELLLRRLKYINGDDTRRIFCKRMKAYVDPATCLKRAEKDEECRVCDTYLELTQSLSVQLVEVDPRTLEDPGYDEGLFPQMSRAEQELLMDSIKTVGFFVPIVLRGNEIICGRERVKAALALGKEKIPALKVNTTETKARIMGIVENICRKVPRSSVDSKKALDRLHELKIGMSVGTNPLSVDKAINQIETLPEQYKRAIQDAYGREADMIYMRMKSQFQRLAKLIKTKIDSLNQDKANLEDKLKALKYEYEEEKRKLRSENTEKLFEYRRKIGEMELQLKQQETTLKAEIEILRSELEDTASREKEMERLYHQAVEKIKNRPVVERHPEDYEELQKQLAELKKRASELEKNLDIARRYDRHRDAFYAGFSFIKTHIKLIKETVPQVELATLTSHLRALATTIEREIAEPPPLPKCLVANKGVSKHDKGGKDAKTQKQPISLGKSGDSG